MMRYRFLRFPEGKYKAVTLSYDDGHVCDKRMAEIMEPYGLKCTFNINSRRMGSSPKKLTAQEIQKELVDRGHEIAVHGRDHRAPCAIRPVEAMGEFLDGRRELEEIFGRIIRGCAYPDSGIRVQANGSDYEGVKNFLTAMDIVYARTLGGDNDGFEMPTDWHAWMPTAHHRNPEIFSYIEKFNKLKDDGKSTGRRPRLFYLWGHSYEFDQEIPFNSWAHFEAICKALSGKEDTWYATNMEIYEYVKAYDSLIFSADGKRVYNPTLQKVWFDQDGVLYTIDSGETILIKE